MLIRHAPVITAFAIVLTAGLSAASAQQGGSGQERAPAARGDARQAQQGQDARQMPARPTVVMTFTVEDAQAEDLVSTATDLARAPFVAQLVVSPQESAASGTLVFRSPQRFSDWRSNRMETFFGRFGEAASIETTLRMFRADLLRTSDPRAGANVGGVSIAYSNADNDAAGDADIDAVTVVCPGDDAECSPSN